MNLKYSLATGQLRPSTPPRCCYWSLLSSSVYYQKGLLFMVMPGWYAFGINRRLGNKLFGRQFVLPRWLDIPRAA